MRDLEIIFEDQDLVVINKPAHLLSIPDRWDQDKESLYHTLLAKRKEIFTVHRLDKDTTGVIVYAKNEAAHKTLNDQFADHENHKSYLAIVHGQVFEPGKIDIPIASDPYHPGRMVVHKKGKEALTEYEPLENFKEFTLLKVIIHTGRTHQIRVHLCSIGYPIAYDPLYGSSVPITIDQIKKKNLKLTLSDETPIKPLLARVPLHAEKLTIIHPTSGQPMSFEAPLPKDLKALLQQLRKWGK